MSDSQQWYYNDATGVEHGPVSADELQQLVATGVIHAQTDLWTEGLEAWVPATQVEGLIPKTSGGPPPPPPPPAHQPQINLGSNTGINLGSSITPRSMGATSTGVPSGSMNPYAQVNRPKSSPVKWIVLGVVALVVIVFGAIIALTPSEEEKRANIPGYAEYSDANAKITSGKHGSILGNNDEALEISKKFSARIKVFRELTIEKAAPGILDKGGAFPTYCMATTEGDVKTLVIIVQVPKLRKFADDAKQVIAEGAWYCANDAVRGSIYADPKTRLVVGVRGLTIYSKVMIGHPYEVAPDEDKLLEGVTESHDGINSEDKLYQFFVRKK